MGNDRYLENIEGLVVKQCVGEDVVMADSWDGNDGAFNCFVFLPSLTRSACIRVPESGC